MKKRFYKELWRLRFLKMLELEEKSIVNYEALLEETKKRFPGHMIIPHLKELILDEKKHVLLVKELLRILKKQRI